MSEPARKYWFPAKRFGWGWGLPSAWQGWVVFVAWIAAVAAGTRLLPEHSAGFAIYVLTMIVVMIAVGYWKGEPPRWRWGDRDKPPGA